MKRSKTERMIITAILAGMAYLLIQFEFPLIMAFPFLKVDFSDIPILISTFILGPIPGVMTAFVRSLLNFIMNGAGPANLIGNTASFLATTAYLLPVYYMVKKQNDNKHLVSGLTLGSIAMTLVMVAANYFVMLPFYLKVVGLDLGMPISKIVMVGVIPFNIMKVILVSVVFFVVYKNLIPSLQNKTMMIHPSK
ncbi:ECF transporter S component [Vagococcus acidifermentans]|uniref:Riboflavin transporter n=1 Tax=Vagococcus acidifermentans TaxID=564710 RepID=A0A430ANF1_9ENTE|nr:ECF transporter S component [Vagococcus acidifermentans]RSU09503.1 hypothetical protein CBF27_12400 [Vagococcus acidifermentans]